MMVLVKIQLTLAHLIEENFGDIDWLFGGRLFVEEIPQGDPEQPLDIHVTSTPQSTVCPFIHNVSTECALHTTRLHVN